MLDSRQIAEWIAYYDIEPFGEYAAYWRAGVIAAAILNVNRHKKSDRVFLPEDFMPPGLKGETDAQSTEEMSTVLLGAYKAAKKKGLTKKKGT